MLRERVRTGELDPGNLDTAAWLGHELAGLASRSLGASRLPPPPAGPAGYDRLGSLFEVVAALGRVAVIKAGVALLESIPAEGAHARHLHDVHAALEALLRDPGSHEVEPEFPLLLEDAAVTTAQNLYSIVHRVAADSSRLSLDTDARWLAGAAPYLSPPQVAACVSTTVGDWLLWEAKPVDLKAVLEAIEP